MIAVLVVLLILVGLPLGAWWLGSRRAWSRIESRHEESVRAERNWIARHRLTAAEQAAVDRAVTRGLAVADARLRAAVVDRARMIEAGMRAWNEQHTRWAEAVRWLRIVWVLLLVVAVVFAVALGEWSPALPFYVVGAALSFTAGHVRRRNLRRAIERNSDGAS